jgi:hypothetical protein
MVTFSAVIFREPPCGMASRVDGEVENRHLELVGIDSNTVQILRNACGDFYAWTQRPSEQVFMSLTRFARLTASGFSSCRRAEGKQALCQSRASFSALQCVVEQAMELPGRQAAVS